ncbi:HlyD family efflux transporter periplasmic adaptor subunit [Rhizobium sp. P44RR-XXIV]|uniref:HlyD family secretion protein n=1 Tax=Rhizobium sp. P44RR-XXIV TaxID=1921145 RepID=UPI0009CE02C8|nr:HlyD family efflux transporter periplasmic adaptor subunit [Rhizobium sp. P44RR-XXIV]
MSTLFRREVLQAKQDAWLGQVQVVYPLSVRLVAITSLVLLAACLTFSIMGSYTRRVYASGVVMPRAGLITIASPAAGVIDGMAATEGQKVHAGQFLYAINLEATSTAGPTQERVIAALTDQKVALQRELSLRKSMAAVQKQGLKDQLANLDLQHKNLAAQLAADEQSLPLMKASMDRLNDAANRRIVTDASFQSQAFIYAEALGQHAQFEQTYLTLEGKIADVTAQLSLFDDNLEKDVSGLDRAISQLDQQIAEVQAKQAIQVLAPADGVLTAVRAHVGQPVGAGAVLVTLLPNGQALQADLYVDSSSIGFIKEGAPVLLRFAAFPFQRFGLYEGRVKEITRAPVQAISVAETGSSLAAGGQAPSPGSSSGQGGQYRVVVEPDLPYVIVDGNQKPLEVGMEVGADIALDSRRIYEWALDPLYRARSSIGVVTGVPKQAAP